jgi:hypothetical protein
MLYFGASQFIRARYVFTIREETLIYPIGY